MRGRRKKFGEWKEELSSHGFRVEPVSGPGLTATVLWTDRRRTTHQEARSAEFGCVVRHAKTGELSYRWKSP